jgi:Arc/MetJ family transcription regulator
MRVHIVLDDDLVADLDRRVAPRERSAFIAQAVRSALEDRYRWEQIESAVGSVRDRGHAWDDDPAAWVREQRRGDARRVG